MPGIPLPPSLRNIRKELLADLGDIWPAGVGTLTPWASQGVLLLNTILTVEEGNPTSHAGIGWEDLTSRLLGAIVHTKKDEPVVFVAWGKYAQSVIYKLKFGPKHTVLAGVHPSPLSAHNGFFGSKPFSKINTFLLKEGATPIQWNLGSSDPTDEPN
jgi:uracil-DNA glycosylase